MTIHLGRIVVESVIVHLGVLSCLVSLCSENEKDLGYLVKGFLLCAVVLLLVHQLAYIYLPQHLSGNWLIRDILFKGKTSKIKITNLSNNVGEGHLKEIFSRYGTVCTTDFPYRRLGLGDDEQSIAYVEFTEPESAHKAVEYLNGGTIDGQTVGVSQLMEENQRTIQRRPFCDAGLWCSLLLPLTFAVSKKKDVIDESTTDLDFCFLLLTSALTIFEYKLSVVTQVLATTLPLWMSCELSKHGYFSLFITAVMLFAYFFALCKLPSTFQGSFTEGELAILLQMFLIKIHNFMQHILKSTENLHDILASAKSSSKIAILAFCGVTSATLLIFVLNTKRKPQMFYVAYVTAASIVVLPLFSLMYSGNFLEILAYFTSPNARVYLTLYWAALVMLSIFTVIMYNACFTSRAFPGLRKCFHLAVIAVYIPGIILDPDFLFTCSVLALGLMVIVETIRYLNVPPFGAALRKSFTKFLDHQDSGELILTPLYLLIGVSLPIWLYHGNPISSTTKLIPYVGVLSIGIGDTMAAIGGSTLGKIQLPDSSKTLEGVLFSWTSQIIFILLLKYYGAVGSVSKAALVSLGLCSMLEGFTKQIDNLILPVFTLLLIMTTS